MMISPGKYAIQSTFFIGLLRHSLYMKCRYNSIKAFYYEYIYRLFYK